jgi:rare lipoprotein A
MMRRAAYGLALAALLALAGCGSAPQQPAHTPAVRPAPAAKPSVKPEPGVPVLPPAGSGRGGYYQDDGPGENPPPNLMATPDAEVRNEPLNPRNSKPYVVFGKTYTPITDPDKTFVQRGLGTWYGKKFHGQRTSSGEIYDMYKMSAAHPTLPIPSYAKVTNLDNGNQVVVRINDRGPFHSTRVIDVSYTAALKLGLLGKGSHQLEVERILPADVDRFNAERSQQKAAALLLESKPAPKPENKPKPRAPSEMAAMLYPAPPSGSAVAAAAAAPAPAQESAAPGPALASQGPQPLQAMPRAAPLILTPQAGAAMPVAVSQAAMAAPAAAGGFYLQLGAYGRKENAEAVRAKLAMDGGLNGLEIVPSGDVHRLYAGPYATRQDAAQAIPALPSAMGLKPLIIQR